MEERVVHGPALSELSRRIRLTDINFERLMRVLKRWWPCAFLVMVLVSSATLCLALPSVTQGSQVSLVQEARLSSSISFATGDQNRNGVSRRRQLITQDGDYENVPLIEKEADNAVVDTQTQRSREDPMKTTESNALNQNAVNADEDYESVSLTRVARKESDKQEQVEGESQKVIDRMMEMHDHVNASEEASAARDSKTDHSGVEKMLDRLEETLANEDDGRFNRTISEQEGVLETVARVGGRSFDDEEDEEVTEAEKEASKLIDAEILKMKPNEDNALNEATGGNENATDMTWLDRIMGQADQSSKSDSHTKEGYRDLGGNQSMGTQKKNVTRERALEENLGHHQADDVPRLIDRSDNEYVISNPGKNKMMLQEDLTLISDIVVVIVTAALGATICSLLGQPVILGYLMAGMVVGPGGLHLVHELVQVETLAQFGVVFLLFVLGVEFNPAKMQGIHSVTLGGGCLQIGTAMLLGGLLGATIPQGVFIGAFLSMSSTAVVVKCLMDSKMGGTEPGQIMLGTLILQDCALGLLLAVMPALAAKGSDTGTFVLALSRATLLLILFCGSVWILSKTMIPRFLRALVQLTKFNSELFLLGALGICLSLALISESLGLSLEVGAFVGGLVLSGGAHTEKTLHQVEPIRNLFAALFLAAIGMVMHPVFLWEHIDILMTSLAVVFIGKTCLIAVVVRAFGYSGKNSLSVGVALAQIGEFAFILLSRAQGLGLVSKKLYLLLMGTSALSLVLTPFAFKIVIRLNPPNLLLFKKTTSKPIHNPVVNIPGEVEKGVPGKSDQPSIDSSAEVFSSNGESIDLEDGRGDRSVSPARVVMRRPYNPGVGGKWNEWRQQIASPDFF